jgi:hypothetical protein
MYKIHATTYFGSGAKARANRHGDGQAVQIQETLKTQCFHSFIQLPVPGLFEIQLNNINECAEAF